MIKSNPIIGFIKIEITICNNDIVIEFNNKMKNK